MKAYRRSLKRTARLIRLAKTEPAFPEGLADRVSAAMAAAPRLATAAPRRVRWSPVIGACVLVAAAVLVAGALPRRPVVPPRPEEPSGTRPAVDRALGRQEAPGVREAPRVPAAETPGAGKSGPRAGAPKRRLAARGPETGTKGVAAAGREEVPSAGAFRGKVVAGTAQLQILPDVNALSWQWSGRYSVGYPVGALPKGALAFGLSHWGTRVTSDAVPRKAAAVRRLIGLLQDPDWVVRTVSAQMLGELNDPNAIKPLIAALQDSHPDVRGSAAHALGRLGATAAVGPLIAALEREDHLTWRGPHVCVPTSGNYAHYPLIGALGQIGDSRAVPALVSLLKHQDAPVRAAAAYGLGQLGDRAAVGPLLAALRDTDDRVRGEAARSLAKLGDRDAIPALVTALSDPRRHVHRDVAWALGELGAKEAVAPLLADLQAKDSDRRGQAAEALGRIGGPQVVGPLTALLADPDDWVQRAAAEALPQARLGARWAWRQEGIEAANTIAAKALQGDDAELRSAAIAFLHEQPTQAGWDALKAALSSPTPAVRYEAAIALGPIISARKAEVLREALQQGDPRTRQAAASVLGEIRDADAVEPLIAALASDDLPLVQNAAEALGNIGDPRAVAPILALVNRGDNWLGSGAVRALADIGDSGAVDGLIGIVTGKDAEIRGGAAFALGVLGDARAREVLVRALQDDEPLGRLRHAAALALLQQGWKPADRAQQMRLLVALERWEEAAQTASAVATSPQRAKGRLEFDLPIIVPLKAEADGRAVIVPHWIELSRRDEEVRAQLFMTTSTWPKSSWRIGVDLLDDAGKVVSRAEIVHETEGIIMRLALSFARAPVFELGPWKNASRANRFAVRVERIPSPPGP